jgi:hypothetical protein
LSGSGGSPVAGSLGGSPASTGSNPLPFTVPSGSGGSIPHDQPPGTPTAGD